MKKNLQVLKNYGLMLLSGCLLSTGVAVSQSVIPVDGGLGTLTNAVIAANAGDTLLLARGGDYSISSTLIIDKELVIKGESTPSGDRPALVMLTADPGSGGVPLIETGFNFSLINVGLIGYTDDGQHPSVMVSCTAADIAVTLNGCIVQGANQVLSSGKNGLKIVQKNNIFYNLCGLVWDNWTGFGFLWGNDNTDFQCYNNTFFTVGRVLNLGGSTGKEFMDHNTYVNSWGDTYYPSYAKDFTCTNNIFFNTQMRGYVGPRAIPYPSGDSVYNWVGDFSDWGGGTIPATDTLAGDMGVFEHPADTTAAGRIVKITNNLKFNEKRVLDFHKANGVTEQPLIALTDYVYAAKYKGWDLTGNLKDGTAYDPKFAMGALPEAAFAQAFITRLNRHLPVVMRAAGFPFEIAYRPGGEARGEFIWPLPFDFKPTVATCSSSSDGFPLGNLNLWGADVVAAYEAKGSYTGNCGIVGVKNITNSDLGLLVSGKIITFDGADNASVSLVNVAGVEVAKLAISANTAVIPSDIASGVYIVKLQVGGSVQTKKAIVIQ